MTDTNRESITELQGATIKSASYVEGDGGSWFDIEIETEDGLTITSGGYKADAGASLTRGDETIKEWNW